MPGELSERLPPVSAQILLAPPVREWLSCPGPLESLDLRGRVTHGGVPLSGTTLYRWKPVLRRALDKPLARDAVGWLRRVDNDAGSTTQSCQRLLGLQYAEMARSGRPLPPLYDTYMRAYSQNGEDGALLFLFSVIGSTSHRAVEICAGDGVQCNSANLIVNHGWDALLVDGNQELVERGRYFYSSCCPDTFSCPPMLVQAWVTAENVNDLVKDAGFASEIDLLSLDMDGVDYWIWRALSVITPRVVVVEYQDIWGPDEALTVPYRADFAGDKDFNYQGASLLAYVKLAAEKGYRLVGVEHLGFNAFFVRNDIATDVLPEVDHRSCFGHRKVQEGMRKRLPLVRDKAWVQA